MVPPAWKYSLKPNKILNVEAKELMMLLFSVVARSVGSIQRWDHSHITPCVAFGRMMTILPRLFHGSSLEIFTETHQNPQFRRQEVDSALPLGCGMFGRISSLSLLHTFCSVSLVTSCEFHKDDNPLSWNITTNLVHI